jgi:hypothetical protein
MRSRQTSIYEKENQAVMKERMKAAAKRAAQNPVLQKSARSIKPEASIWGALGVILFFIVPEIIGFVWGEEITAWAHRMSITQPDEMERKLYWVMEKLFEDGGSWVNLGIGLLLLFWLFWEWRKGSGE